MVTGGDVINDNLWLPAAGDDMGYNLSPLSLSSGSQPGFVLDIPDVSPVRGKYRAAGGSSPTTPSSIS